MAFSEVREYQFGDDIRSIDWNVTARFDVPYVKIFEEERELTVILLVDVSGSREFGTREKLKHSLITELCAVLSFSAIQNNDKIGVIFFSDQVEKFIPPKKGKSHILRIIRELIDFEPDHKKTNLGEALRFFTGAIKKKSIAFIISDFMDENYEDALKIASKKHDVAGIRIHDRREKDIPAMGLVQFRDAETGELRWIDTSSEEVRKTYKIAALEREAKITERLRRAGVDFCSIATDESYVAPLINLFKRREK